MTVRPLRIAIVAGEVSGDGLGAALIHELRMLHPASEFFGVGGKQMAAAGCRLLYSCDVLAVMGVTEVLRKLPKIYRIYRQLSKIFRSSPPDVFIGIDAPDFNLPLESKLRRANIPIVHYVSPSVWAWKSWRIRKIAKTVNLMLTLFPFETAIYAKHHIPVKFVGHPLARQLPLKPDKLAARQQLNIAADAKVLALLPGSRKQELNYLAALFLQTAYQCWQQMPTLKILVPLVNARRYQQFEAIRQAVAPTLPIECVMEQAQLVMIAADSVLLASGTATLEAMLCKRPMVVAYKMAYSTYQIAKLMVHTPYIALPNILVGKPLVPEFIQAQATADRLTHATLEQLQAGELAAEIKAEFVAQHERLMQPEPDAAAAAILQLCMPS